MLRDDAYAMANLGRDVKDYFLERSSMGFGRVCAWVCGRDGIVFGGLSSIF